MLPQPKDIAATGHPIIDSDHQSLLTIIDRLSPLVDDDNRQTIEVILEDLINHVISHFGREEQMMIQARYPEYNAHMMLHSKFFASLTQFIFMFEMNEAGLTDSMRAFLGQWLREHEAGHDKEFVDFLNARERSGVDNPPPS